MSARPARSMPSPSPAVRASATQPGWLRRSITRLSAIVGVFLFPVAVGVPWPLDVVGNAYQLLGVFIAALGVPIVGPQLDGAERWLEGAAVSVGPTQEVLERAWGGVR